MMHTKFHVVCAAFIVFCYDATLQNSCSPRVFRDVTTYSNELSAGESNVTGYVYLGAVFPVRDAYDGSGCGDVTREGAMAVEAFAWALRTHNIRADTNCRLNADLKGIVFDTCGEKQKMFEDLNAFESCSIGFRLALSNTTIDPKRVVGYVGPNSFQLVYHSAYMFELVNKINVITSTTVPNLGLKRNSFHLFPSVSKEAIALANVIHQQNWKYVIVLYSADAFGASGYLSFVKETHSNNINIVMSEKLPANDNKMKKLADNLRKYKEVKILVCFAHPAEMDIIWSTLRHDFVFMTPSSFGFHVSSLLSSKLKPDVYAGLVSLIPKIYDHYQDKYLSKLRGHFRRLDPAKSDNMVLKQYWETRFNCTLSGNELDLLSHNRTCDVQTELDIFNTDMPASIVAIPQAVDALLTAVRKLSNTLCSGQICDKLFDQRVMSEQLAEKLRRAKLINMKERLFEDLSSEPMISTFIVTQIQDGGTFKIVKMNSKTIHSESRRLKFYNSKLEEETINSSCPRSLIFCRRKFGGSDIQRNSSEYGLRFYVYGHGWDIAVAVVASSGITMALLLAMVCIYYGYNGVIQFVFIRLTLLFGIICGFMTSYAFMFVPSIITCGITRFGVGFSYAVCFSVLLLLTLRFAIKPRNQWSVESSSLLKYRFPQIILFLFALGTQVAIMFYWLFTVRPDHASAINDVEIKFWMCNHYTGSMDQPLIWAELTRTDFINHVLSLTYIMILIVLVFLISLWGALKRQTGSTLDTFERRGVAWVSFLVIVVWIVWPLVGALLVDHMYAAEVCDASLAFGLLVTVIILLVFFSSHILYEIKSPKYHHMSFKDGDMSVQRSDSAHSSRAMSSTPVARSPPPQPNRRISYIKVAEPGSANITSDRKTSELGYRNGHVSRTPMPLSYTLPRPNPDFYHTRPRHPHHHSSNVACKDCGFGYDPTSLHLVHPRSASLNQYSPSQDTTLTSTPSKVVDTSFVTDRSYDSRGMRTVSDGVGTQFKGARSAHGLASTYSAPSVYYTAPDTAYGTGRMLRVTRELTGGRPNIFRVNRSFSDYDDMERRRKIKRSKSAEKLGML